MNGIMMTVRGMLFFITILALTTGKSDALNAILYLL